jgi:hypothetical protein
MGFSILSLSQTPKMDQWLRKDLLQPPEIIAKVSTEVKASS